MVRSHASAFRVATTRDRRHFILIIPSYNQHPLDAHHADFILRRLRGQEREDCGSRTVKRREEGALTFHTYSATSPRQDHIRAIIARLRSAVEERQNGSSLLTHLTNFKSKCRRTAHYSCRREPQMETINRRSRWRLFESRSGSHRGHCRHW